MHTRNVIENKPNDVFGHLFLKVQQQWLEYWEAISFIILIGIKVLYYGKQISTESYSAAMMVPPVLVSILPFLAIAFLFKNRTRAKFLYITNLIISIILLADTVYFRYFKDIISVGAIRNGLLVKDMSSSISALIKLKDFVYFIDIILLIPIFILAKNIKRNQPTIRFRIMVFSLLFALGVGLDGSFIYKLSKEQPLLITTMSNKLYLTKSLGNINFHVLDIYNYVTKKLSNMHDISSDRKAEIQTFLTNNNNGAGKNFAGVGTGKNLIMIQVEALQQFVINSKVNGQEITPNLNKFLNKSLYFDNYFYQVAAGNTSDAEFMSNNSLYPAASGAAYYQYAEDTLNSLPKELNAKGYNTAAFHGYEEGFWNRNVMYKTEGFDTFYGEHSFNIDEQVGLGLSDKSFLNQSFEKLKTLKQPYFSFLITLSSHFPYDDVKGYGNFNVGQYENTFLGNYLKGIHYTDEQLGTFLDKLEKSGILDNSIVVLYGDHYAIPKDYINQLYQFENIQNADDYKWYQLQKVPMLIHFPKDANKGINHTYSGQMDLYPTLANMFGLSDKYMFGHDIFNSTDKKVIFRSGSFTDGNVFYISWINSYFDIKTGEKIPETSELKQTKEEVLKELSYSDDILNHNLLKDK